MTPAPSPAAPRLRGALLSTLKLAVALTAFAWLYEKGYLDVSRMSTASLVLGFLLLGLQGLGNAVRLRWVFLVHGLPVKLGRTISLTWLALAFNQILPGGAGGDALRAYYAAQDYPEAKASAVVAVLFDKVIGLVGLLLLGVVPWALVVIDGGSVPPAAAGVIRAIGPTMAAAFAGVAAVAFVALSPRASAWAARVGLRARLGPRAGRLVHPLVLLVAAHRGARLRLLGLTVFAALLHATACVALYLIARAAGDTNGFALHLALWSVVFLTTVIPLSPGGLGVSEAAAAKLWLLCGVTTGATTYLGFRVVSMLHAGIGLLVYVGMRRSVAAGKQAAASAP